MYGLKIEVPRTLQRTHLLTSSQLLLLLLTTSHNDVQNPISEEQQTPSNFDLLTQQRCLKLNLRTDHH